MRRLMLFAIALAALLCAPAARSGLAASRDTSGIAAPASSPIAGESHRSHGSDRHWRPEHHSTAAATESIWKSAPIHAALASARSTIPSCASSRPASAHAPPAVSTPTYLRHTPLLI